MDFSPSQGGRNWNAEFQQLLESRLADPKNELKRTKELRKLCEDFGEMAQKIGTVIIRELFLPIGQKTIPPATSAIGGVAGGEKYVYQPEGIFFKIAVDKRGLYGGDEFIMKAAGHELRGLMEYMDCRVSGLYFPLMVLVDYRGYRLIAESILPLGPRTLIYGSSDGGRTIRADNAEMNARMETAAGILNLKGHYVWNWEQSEKTLIYGPVDLEGHLGTDNRFYVIDTARVFPPQTPLEGVKGCFLYRLLRPELVKKYRVALSSDAFSRFPIEEAAAHNEEVRLASEYLEHVLTKQLAKFLVDHYEPLLSGLAHPVATEASNSSGPASIATLELREEFSRLVDHVHRVGVNVRCLGAVLAHIPTHHKLVRQFVMTEIVARTAKNILRHQMRKIKSPDDQAYVRVVIKYFNLIFSHSKRSRAYWTQHLPESLQRRFPVPTTEGRGSEEVIENGVLSVGTDDMHQALSVGPSQVLSSSPSSLGSQAVGNQSSPAARDNIREAVLMQPLFQRLQDITGLRFRKQALSKFEYDQDLKLTGLQAALEEDDLEDIYAVVKHVHRISFEEGTALSLQAARHEAGALSDAYFKVANEKYSAGLRIKPADYRALHNWGLSLSLQAATKEGAEAEALFESAASKYEAALLINPKDDRALFLWGNLLSEWSRTKKGRGTQNLLELACRKYQQAYAINPSNFELLYNWGNVLLYRTKIEDDNPLLLKHASRKYAKALALKPSSYNALRNWGVALSKYARIKKPSKARALFAQAEEKFKECLLIKPSDYEVYFNWGNTLYRQARMQEAHPSACALLLAAGDKYLQALDIIPHYHDAFYNWGKVLHCLGSSSSRSAPNPSYICRIFELYISLLTSLLQHFGAAVKLKPVIVLGRSGIPGVRTAVISALQHYQSMSSVKIQKDATRALRGLLSLPAPPAPSPQPSFSSLTQIDSIEQHVPTIPDDPALSWEGGAEGDLQHIADMVRSITRKLAKLPMQAPPSATPSALSTHDFDVVAVLSESSLQRELKVRHRGQGTTHLLKIMPRDATIKRLSQGQTAITTRSNLNKTTEMLTSPLNKVAIQNSQPTLKRINAEPEESEPSSDDLAKIVERLWNVFLLPLRWTLETQDNLFMIYDSIWSDAGLMLHHHIHALLPKAQCPPVLPIPLIRFISAEIILALRHLHDLDFVYGRLTPDTIMIDREGHVCLIKFSFQRQCTSYSVSSHTDAFDTTYISPEVIGGGGYGKASDWWSLGNLIHEMATGWPPFHSQDINRHLQNVMKGGLNLAHLDSLPPDLIDLISHLLCKNPQERLGANGAKDVQAHPFFAGIDWDELGQKKVEVPWKPLVAEGINSELVGTTGDWRDLSDFDESLRHFEAMPTLVANLKKGKFHGYTFVHPRHRETVSASMAFPEVPESGVIDSDIREDQTAKKEQISKNRETRTKENGSKSKHKHKRRTPEFPRDAPFTSAPPPTPLSRLQPVSREHSLSTTFSNSMPTSGGHSTKSGSRHKNHPRKDRSRDRERDGRKPSSKDAAAKMPLKRHRSVSGTGGPPPIQSDPRKARHLVASPTRTTSTRLRGSDRDKEKDDPENSHSSGSVVHSQVALPQHAEESHNEHVASTTLTTPTHEDGVNSAEGSKSSQDGEMKKDEKKELRDKTKAKDKDARNVQRSVSAKSIAKKTHRRHEKQANEKAPEKDVAKHRPREAARPSKMLTRDLPEKKTKKTTPSTL